jgi:nucleotide-binding universal stress UspA family protein
LRQIFPKDLTGLCARAVLLARASGVPLDILHVVDDDRSQHIVEREAMEASILLREMTGSLRSLEGVEYNIEIVLADPFAGIVQAVSGSGPVLLVLRPHRRQILKDAFVGTTAERTIRSVDWPVLMVNGPPVGPWRQVLLTTDLSDLSGTALRRFCKLDLKPDARRSILYAFDTPALRLATSDALPKDEKDAYVASQKSDACRELAGFTRDLPDLGAEPMVRNNQTTTAYEIKAAARETNADLIVVSTQGKGALSRMLIGIVAEQVLQSAADDVLALPPRG